MAGACALTRVNNDAIKLVDNLRELIRLVFLRARLAVDPLGLVFPQIELAWVLDDISAFLAPAVPDKVNHEDAWRCFDRTGFLSVDALLASRALVLVVASKRLAVDEGIDTILEGRFLPAGHVRNRQRQIALLSISVRLIAAILTENLLARFEPEQFENGRLLLLLDQVSLCRLLMVEARLDQVIKKSKRELLGVLLLTHNMFGQDLHHVL